MVRYIGIDFGGAERARAPNNWETPIHLSLFYHLPSPNILVFPPNIFDKSTPVVGYVLYYYNGLNNFKKLHTTQVINEGRG